MDDTILRGRPDAIFDVFEAVDKLSCDGKMDTNQSGVIISNVLKLHTLV
jgi:hypothetical protein